MDLQSTNLAASRAADIIHWAFDEHQLRLRAITQRVRQRFERCDWLGIRQDTVERMDLHPRAIHRTCDALREPLGDRFADRETWTALKEAYTREIIGRNDFELAQTFFNSLTRLVFPRTGVDPAIDYVADDFPLPYRGWEMASARMYAVRRIDAAVIRKVLEDAGFRTSFRDLEGDAALAAERVQRGLREAFGSEDIQALDVLRPVFIRNKGAYVIGRARRGEEVRPVVLAMTNGRSGIEVDAVLHTEDETSVVFSFARWYFHADVESPREVIGFLRSILPRKRISELYISLGYTKHGKTEFYRDLMHHIARSDDLFVPARGRRGLVMDVFTLPSYPFVFKVIKDRFPPSKNTTREKVMEKYREVLAQDRVGRLVDFQEFEHLSFPRARFSEELLSEILQSSSQDVGIEGDTVVVRHAYVERRVTPLDVFLAEAAEAGPEREGAALSALSALSAVDDWGRCLRDLAAANIFPGDVLLKNFGVTRHGRVVFYDYDELASLTSCRFRPFPAARHHEDEMAAEPWFSVGEHDVFPEELRTFLGLEGALRDAFLARHGELFDPGFWQGMQERNREGEVIAFYPYGEARRLRPAPATSGGAPARSDSAAA
ncbi:MAG TPA: bifunctional isocitrate dehydrogenase kinase/phosphatase [Thermoanaerobaculia bacterium]|nr:bifunctional isocitrate dehydrogenase kinase/phosphatase [Thermoanaerobaculia bacterium]